MFASEMQSSGSIKLRKSKVQIPPNLQHIYQYFIWAESIQTSPRQIKTNNASSHSNHDCTSKYFKPHNSKKSDAYINMNYLTVHLIDSHMTHAHNLFLSHSRFQLNDTRHVSCDRRVYNQSRVPHIFSHEGRKQDRYVTKRDGRLQLCSKV